MDAELVQRVEQWLDWDEDAATRREVQRLADAGDAARLRALLCARMEFGTAGLRAAMGAGYTQMNCLTVLQTAQGLCSYLLEVFPDARERGVVIGYDGRHYSKRFAEISAAVFASRGMCAHLHSRVIPTPLLAFSVGKLRCVAGVMVTASHNPKQDNGYKVYWENACQIIGPHDKKIAAAIEANLKPWFSIGDKVATIDRHPLVSSPTEACWAAYKAVITSDLCMKRDANAASDLRACYTAMHGVGYPYVRELMGEFHLPAVHSVPEQQEPDPEFPTVRFPNPQEGKGALELALALAERDQCDIIVANDPDADRLAVACRDTQGKMVILGGNQIGYLLADWTLQCYRQRGGDVARAAMVASTVSSKFLASMARVEGFRFEETLTGFKYIGNKAIDLRSEGIHTLFAYEEAIGYLVGTNVFDKDGVSAACVFCEMAAEYKRRGTSALARLEELYRAYGYFAQNDSYFLCYEPATVKRIFARIRTLYASSRQLGAFQIRHVRDLTTGFDDAQPDGKPVFPVSSSSQMITFTFTNGCVATLRTSGTEPKIKYYIEMSGNDRADAEAQLAAVSAELIAQYIQPAENSLEAPPA